jgi:predicted metalloenzyme YecM
VELKAIIGDYEAFFSDLSARLERVGIDIQGRPITHLLYRTGSTAAYEKVRDAIKLHSVGFVETFFNGRSVSIFKLKGKLLLPEQHSVSMIEVTAPHPEHDYPEGLENFGVLVGHGLAQFEQRYRDVLLVRSGMASLISRCM